MKIMIGLPMGISPAHENCAIQMKMKQDIELSGNQFVDTSVSVDEFWKAQYGAQCCTSIHFISKTVEAMNKSDAIYFAKERSVTNMKYPKEMYIDSGFYDGGLGDDGLIKKKEKIVKCRKSHMCCDCNKEIKAGEEALLESGFFDGKPVSYYACLQCIESWLEESEQVGIEGDDKDI